MRHQKCKWRKENTFRIWHIWNLFLASRSEPYILCTACIGKENCVSASIDEMLSKIDKISLMIFQHVICLIDKISLMIDKISGNCTTGKDPSVFSRRAHPFTYIYQTEIGTLEIIKECIYAWICPEEPKATVHQRHCKSGKKECDTTFKRRDAHVTHEIYIFEKYVRIAWDLSDGCLRIVLGGSLLRSNNREYLNKKPGTKYGIQVFDKYFIDYKSLLDSKFWDTISVLQLMQWRVWDFQIFDWSFFPFST